MSPTLEGTCPVSQNVTSGLTVSFLPCFHGGLLTPPLRLGYGWAVIRFVWFTWILKIPIPKLCLKTILLKSQVRSHGGQWVKERIGARHTTFHDDVIKWKHFPRCWPFVRVIHRSPVDSPHKGQWRGAWIFSLICRLSKQSRSRWFETPSRSLWRHYHDKCTLHAMSYARCLRFVVFSCGQASTQYTHSLQGYFTGTGKIVL